MDGIQILITGARMSTQERKSMSLLAVFGIAICLAQAALAQQPIVCQPLRGQPIALFDGTSMDGWVKRDGSKPKHWIIQDGALYRSEQEGDLYHQHWFRDFELTFEWKIQKNGNSGVKYRVQQYGNQMLGCEYQVQDDQDKPFNKQATGSIYAIYEPTSNKKTLPLGQWNQSKIVVCGNHVEHWLNGEKIVSAQIGNLDWLTRVENSKFRDKEYFGQNREGRIFLQDHGQAAWYRNIVLVPLDCDPAHPQ